MLLEQPSTIVRPCSPRTPLKTDHRSELLRDSIMSFSDDSDDINMTIDDPVALFSRRSASCVAAFKAGSLSSSEVLAECGARSLHNSIKPSLSALQTDNRWLS